MLQVKLGPEFTGSPLPGMTLDQAFASALPPSPWGMAPDGCVFVGMFELSEWRPWLAEAHALLDVRELARVKAQRSAAHRHWLTLGYALHRLLLGHALGCEAALVPIGRDQAGCPRLPHDRLFTSLSHADHALALAVTAAGAVGVDLEPSSRVAVMAEIAERVCHPSEAAEIDRLGEAARNDALLELWVRKEAFLKAAGIGLQREMSTFAVPERAVLVLPDGKAVRVGMVDAGACWVAAVAGPPNVAIESMWLRPARLRPDCVGP